MDAVVIRSKVTMMSHDATRESMAETSWVHYVFHFELIFGYCVPQKLSPLPTKFSTALPIQVIWPHTELQPTVYEEGL